MLVIGLALMMSLFGVILGLLLNGEPIELNEACYLMSIVMPRDGFMLIPTPFLPLTPFGLNFFLFSECYRPYNILMRWYTSSSSSKCLTGYSLG
jgi:hypothetical protein